MRKTLYKRQKALVESEERLAAIIQNSVEGILTITDGGTICSINTSVERIFDYHSDEIIGKSLTVLIPDFLLDGSSVIGQGHEVQGRRKDQTLFPLWVAIGEVHSEPEQLFVVALLDISAQKDVESELRKHYRAVEDSPIGIVITDTQSVIEYVNSSYSAISGYTKDELVG